MPNQVFPVNDNLTHDIMGCSFTEGKQGGKTRRTYTKAFQVLVILSVRL